MKKNGEYVGVDEKFIPENEKYVDESLLGNKEEQNKKVKKGIKIVLGAYGIGIVIWIVILLIGGFWVIKNMKNIGQKMTDSMTQQYQENTNSLKQEYQEKADLMLQEKEEIDNKYQQLEQESESLKQQHQEGKEEIEDVSQQIKDESESIKQEVNDKFDNLTQKQQEIKDLFKEQIQDNM